MYLVIQCVEPKIGNGKLANKLGVKNALITQAILDLLKK
jgi:hypothetical protein